MNSATDIEEWEEKLNLDSFVLSVRLRIARHASGMTQREAGAEVGCGNTAISHFEAGRKVPTLRSFKSLCEVYGVSADWLLWGD